MTDCHNHNPWKRRWLYGGWLFELTIPRKPSDSQLEKYQRQLDDSLTPNVDPGDYAEITNPKTFRDALENFLNGEHISATLKSTYLDKFDNNAATKKREFNDRYQAGSSPSTVPR